MRTPTVLMSLVVTAAVHAATSLPSGTFVGTGQWRGEGGTRGDYSVETTVHDQVLTSRYDFGTDKGARKETSTMKLAMQGEPFFDILDASDKVIGKGYCYDSQCSYRAELGPVVVEETIDFSKDSIHKFGSKKGANFSVVWKEDLQAK